MSNIKNHLVVASATLLILTIAATNIVQIKPIAFAQNFDVNQKIKEIQTQFPLLSQNSSVKDVIHKVQGLDKDQALKTLAAFHILRNLQEYQALGSAGVSNNSTG
ncbi:MAG TPA: hypothetical protein VN704_03940 [Verrucomicrobiae bacterium]|nr:hypothetical protein [Verrucomicrobiae bacterium]